MYFSKVILTFAALSFLMGSHSYALEGPSNTNKSTSAANGPLVPANPLLHSVPIITEDIKIENSGKPDPLDTVTGRHVVEVQLTLATADPRDPEQLAGLKDLATRVKGDATEAGIPLAVLVENDPMSQMVAQASSPPLHQKMREFYFQAAARARTGGAQYKTALQDWPALFTDKENITFSFAKLVFNIGGPTLVTMHATGLPWYISILPNIPLGSASAALQFLYPFMPWNVFEGEAEKYTSWGAIEIGFLGTSIGAAALVNAWMVAHGHPPVFKTQSLSEIALKTTPADESTQGVYDGATSKLYQRGEDTIESKFKEVPNYKENANYKAAMKRNRMFLNLRGLGASVVAVSLSQGLIMHLKLAYVGFIAFGAGGLIYSSVAYKWPQHKLLREGMIDKDELNQMSYWEALKQVDSDPAFRPLQSQLMREGSVTKEEASQLSFSEAFMKVIDPCRNTLMSLGLSASSAK